MKRRFLFVCLAAFALCGCPQKETCSQNELVEAPPEFLQYWYFPKGSYWVYQLKDTVGVYDTVTVVNDYKRYCDGTNHHADPDCDQDDCVWMYSNTWQHSNYQYFGGNKEYPPQNFNTTYYLGGYWVVKGKAGMGMDIYAPPYPFKHPFTIGEKYMGNNEIVSEDSVQTPAGIFPNTLHIIPDKFQLDSNINNYVQHLYITPNVGVVKWHYTRNRVWELIAYDVTP